MKKKDLVNYVKNKNDSLTNQKIGYFNIVFKDHFINDINYKYVFNNINNLLPDHFLNLVEIVYVGQFDFLIQRDVNASYMDGAIYVSNIQDDEADLTDDIVHEIAHAVEEAHGEEIYSDRYLEQGFVAKRHQLQRVLKYLGIQTSQYDFNNISYDEGFDKFLYKEIGYEKLNNLSIGIYLSPYSMTSIREYFARGFEEYFLGDRSYLRKVCPYIYSKITSLEDDKDLQHETQY